MNCINYCKKTILPLVVLLITAVNVHANVWKGLQNDFKGEPILSAQMGSSLAVLFDNGLTRGGRQFSVRSSNGIIWRELFTFHADSASQVRDMVLFKGDLYFSGSFKNVTNAKEVVNILKFDLKSKEIVSLTTGSQDLSKFKLINQLVVFGNKLVAVGTFSEINNQAGRNVHSFDGRKWDSSPLGIKTGFNGSVLNVLTKKDTIYYSGLFTKADGNASNFIAANFGAKWHYYPQNEIKLGKGIVVGDESIYVGSDKNSILGFYGVSRNKIIAKSEGLASVAQLTDLVINNNVLYASGLFRIKGNSEIQTIIRYDEGKWQAIPGGNTLISVKDLVTFRSTLFALGNFKYDRLKIRKIASYQSKMAFIGGNVFYDKNNNCIVDSRDEILSDVLITASPGKYYAKPDAKGYYRLIVPAGIYTIQIIDKKYWTSADCSESIQRVQVAEGQIRDSVDFARVYKNKVEDVKVSLVSSTGWRAKTGQRQIYSIVYENLGSEKIESGNIKLNFNQKIGPQAIFFQRPDKQELSTAEWNFSELMAGEKRILNFAFFIPENLPDKELEFTAEIAQSANEEEIDDNKSELTQTLTVDDVHNEKQVYPSPLEGEGISYVNPEINEDLTYSINFSNYSGDTINTVYIIDTIDVNLDISFIQELGASHPYTTEVINGPIGSNIAVVVWTFRNLQLLPNPSKELDKLGYSGFINFKIKLNSSVPLGTVVSNTASIIFENDLETRTNTVKTQLQKNVSAPTNQFENLDLNIYPNPADKTLNIESISGSSLDLKCKMFNVMGKRVSCQYRNGRIATSELSSGVYVLEVQNEKSLARKKIVIRH